MTNIKFFALPFTLNVGLTIFTLLYVPVYRGYVADFFSQTETSNQYTERSTRVEWRNARGYEKLGYIAAVQCLSTVPSKIGLNTSLYSCLGTEASCKFSRPHFERFVNTRDHYCTGIGTWTGRLQEMHRSGMTRTGSVVMGTLDSIKPLDMVGA